MAKGVQNLGFDTKIRNNQNIDTRLNRVNFNNFQINNLKKDEEKTYKPDQTFRPVVENDPENEYAGPAMKLVIY